jgi:hypothetical protein
MKAAAATGLCLIAMLATGPARGEPDRSEADELRSSVLEALSLVTFGMVTGRDHAGEVSRNGADYRVRMPLEGFASPPQASLDALARRLGGGSWDILSMSLPSAGTILPGGDGGSRNPVEYVIREQTPRAKIDPDAVQASSFAASFAGIGLRSAQRGQQSEQSIERYGTEGWMSGESAGRVTFTSGNKAENWRLKTRTPDGTETGSSIKTMAGHLELEEVDRARGARFLTAARTMLVGMQAATLENGPGQPPGLSAAQRQALRGMIDASEGLLTKFQADQSFDGIRFIAGAGNGGTMNRLQLATKGEVANERLSARMDIALEGLSLNGLPGGMAAYVPRHIAVRSTLSGVPTEELRALLRAASGPETASESLQAQIMRLLNEPGSRFGLEAVRFDSGPLRLEGSARSVPHPGGQPGATLHLSATGVDALIAQMQKMPALQQALPMMFMAKGMGRPAGEAVVWDISLDEGVLTVNGVPLGQGGR